MVITYTVCVILCLCSMYDDLVELCLQSVSLMIVNHISQYLMVSDLYILHCMFLLHADADKTIKVHTMEGNQLLRSSNVSNLVRRSSISRQYLYFLTLFPPPPASI